MATFAQWVKLQEDRQDGIGYFARYWRDVTPGKISSVDGIKRVLDRISHETTTESEQARLGAALAGYTLAVREYHRARAADEARANGLSVAPDPPTTEDSPDYRYDSSLGLAGQPLGSHPYPEGPSGSGTADLAAFRSAAQAELHLTVNESTGEVTPGKPYPLHLHTGPGAYGLTTDVNSLPQITRKDPQPGDLRPVEARLPVDKLDRIASELGVIGHRLADLEDKLDAVLSALYPEPVDWAALHAAADFTQDGAR